MSDREVLCPRCGGHCGEPGSNFGDHGWHPCYFCGDSGYVTADAAERDEQPLPPEYDDILGCSAEDPTCPYCSDPTCDPGGDGTGRACDRALREYERIVSPPRAPYVPPTDDEIPF